MPSKVPCYLRTLRKKWGLTQKELASLVPHCRRNRVSDVERGKILPRASELLAYALIFGFPSQAIFRKYAEDIEDAVMRVAAEFDRRLTDDDSPSAARKIDFLEQLSNRVRLEVSEIPNL